MKQIFMLMLFLPSTGYSSVNEANSLHSIVCTHGDQESLLSSDLKTPVAQLPAFFQIKKFQGWGSNRRLIMQDGVEIEYVKVQTVEPLSGEPLKTGWLPAELVRQSQDCALAQSDNSSVVNYSTQGSAFNAGLDDPSCCKFPLPTKANADYASGMRRFGAGRDGGNRLHAACDLYKTTNSPILAITDGVVLSDLYFFYQGTYALEVKHTGGFVVRYGEVTGKKFVSAGAKVKLGQQIGNMGKVNSNCCEPMLHFELFSGKAKGSLTAGGSYRRRSDLMNPTSHLKKWEP